MIREIDASLNLSNIGTKHIRSKIDEIYWRLTKEVSLTNKYYREIENLVRKNLELQLINEFNLDYEFRESYINILSEMISYQVEYLETIKVQFRKEVSEFLKKNDDISRVILTNGLFGTYGISIADALLFNNCLIVSSEHGLTRGNIKEYNEAIRGYETNTSNHYLSFTNSSCKTHQKVSKNNVMSVGVPNELKIIKFHYLQNIINRKRLGFLIKDKIVFYASHNVIINSDKYFPYTKQVSNIYKDEVNLLSNVLSKINKKVIYKEYPSKNYLDDIPKTTYKNIFNLNKDEDFRYQRTMADIIITQGSESTLGWCIGTNKPLIFLNSNYYEPLADDNVKNAFMESFFVFNYDNEGWEEKLIEFLNKPYNEILRLWNEKEKYRLKYDEEYFLSMNKNPAKLGSEHIKGLIDEE